MKKLIFLAIVLLNILVQGASAQKSIPHLQKVGNHFQMVVNDKPFLMLAGELGNSTASTIESMEPVWPRLKELNLNTVLVPVYWELLEPKEGEFDYKLIDNLIQQARNYDLKLVFLWFGSWKNSMSSHAPAWVKLDQKRFPRAKSDTGESQEILTPFAEANLQADLNAYKHLLKHIGEIDAVYQTVILMQTENEIGMIPSVRDYNPLANQKFKEEVPADLIAYLVKNKKELNPEFSEIWEKNGFKTKGSWEEIFGKGVKTDEIFMAYYFAIYTGQVCAAGKAEYAIPAYVNAALIIPSSGPLPHVLDIWKAGSPQIDFYSPDLYNPQFKKWADLYARQGNPLFIPEHQFDNTVAAKALFAIGQYEAMGFSPFSIEQKPGIPFTAKENKLAKVYDIINQIQPLLNSNRGQNKIRGVLLSKEVKETTFVLGDYEFTAGHTYNFGWEPESKSDEWEPAGAIIIQTGEKEFYYAGFGVSVRMKNLKKNDVRVGILQTERGSFKDGKWVVYQHLNGDQTHQGRHIRSFVDDVSIQRFSLYEYE